MITLLAANLHAQTIEQRTPTEGVYKNNEPTVVNEYTKNCLYKNKVVELFLFCTYYIRYYYSNTDPYQTPQIIVTTMEPQITEKKAKAMFLFIKKGSIANLHHTYYSLHTRLSLKNWWW